MEYEERVYDGHGGVSIKRSVTVFRGEYEEEDTQWGRRRNYTRRDREEVLVGVKAGEIRLRYPVASGGRVNYLETPSSDLKSLAALFVCDLVPAGVFADALEESFPEHGEAADILREYERIKLKEEIERAAKS